jgi:hypothetical protein
MNASVSTSTEFADVGSPMSIAMLNPSGEIAWRNPNGLSS